MLLKKGDAVHVFDPAQPDGEAPLRTVARVSGEWSSSSLWLEGDKGAAGWCADGRRRVAFSRDTQRLIRPADLQAARDEARQQRAIENRRQRQGQATQALAHVILQAGNAIEYTHGVKAVAEKAKLLRDVLSGWVASVCPGCSACADNHVEPLCDGSGLRGE